MKRAKRLISTLLYNKFFLQLILAAFMIGMAVFFISHQHLEVLKIRDQLSQSNPWYVLLGIVLTVLYVVFQGMMYVYSFKALGQKVSFLGAVRLYLKRNLVSIFLPAGGFSSLLFFTREVENEGVSKSQIHLASTLFGFISILSVVVVAVPILGFALLSKDLQLAEMLGFGFLLLLTSAFFLLFYSVSKKGKAYRWISRLKPSLVLILDEMIGHQIDNRKVWKTLFFSILIEFIGIIHLYIAMLALGLEASWMASSIGYITMVILLMASPFLRGLGAIEVSLTLILGQFGLPMLMAAAVTLLFRFFEFWLLLLGGLLSFITHKDNLILRVLPAFILLLLGVVNMISSVTPAIPERLMMMRGLIPDELIHASNVLVLVFGFLLLILSVFLLQGSKRAWYVGLFLTVFSFIGHIIKGADYEEATLAFVAFASLLFTKNGYKLKPHPVLTRISYIVLTYSIIAILTFGVSGLYFMNNRHFGMQFDFWVAVKTILRLFFLFDDSGLQPRTVFAQNFIYTIYALGGMLLSFIFFSILKPYFSKPYNSHEDRVLARSILEKYGRSALDYFKTYPDKFYFFSDNRDGFISFKVTRYFAIVLENPVCKDEEAFMDLVRKFDTYCQENGFVSVFYRVPQQSLKMYESLGKKYLPVGDEAVVDLNSNTLDGGKIKTTTSAVHRLTTDGFIVNIHTAPHSDGFMKKLELVSQSWLDAIHQKEIAFTEGVFDVKILRNQTIITVEDVEERVYAFLNLIPDYAPGEATYDMIRKIKDAPNGVLDLLLAKTLQYLKEQGFESVNLGLAPLSGVKGINFTEKAVKYAYENLKALGHFKGLRNYKDKFQPRWEPKFLVYSQAHHLLQVPGALKRVSEGK